MSEIINLNKDCVNVYSIFTDRLVSFLKFCVKMLMYKVHVDIYSDGVTDLTDNTGFLVLASFRASVSRELCFVW